MSRTAVSTVSPGLAETFSPSKTYDEGDFVLYQNKYWRKLSTSSSGSSQAWDPDEWKAVDDALTPMVRKDMLEGKSMPASPTQRQIADAVKELWRMLGGTVACVLAAASAYCGEISATNEWQDVPGSMTLGTVTSNVVTKPYIGNLGFSNPSDKKYAMFVINVNPGSTATTFSGFELKASTNNFENGDLIFYTASAGNHVVTPGNIIDYCKLYYLSTKDGGDGRVWRYVHQVTSLRTYYPREWIVIVDPSELNRGQGSAWCRESNESLVWSYTRIGETGYEKDDGGSNALWRPIYPIKWFSELPAWAQQD